MRQDAISWRIGRLTMRRTSSGACSCTWVVSAALSKAWLVVRRTIVDRPSLCCHSRPPTCYIIRQIVQAPSALWHSLSKYVCSCRDPCGGLTLPSAIKSGPAYPTITKLHPRSRQSSDPDIWTKKAKFRAPVGPGGNSSP
jgi:hypothetical protein